MCLDASVGFGLRVDDVLAGDVVTSALIARAEVASRDDVADDALALDVQIQEERDELRDAHARGGGVGEGARAKARGGVVGDVVSPDVVREGRGRARGEDAARSARERRGGARTAEPNARTREGRRAREETHRAGNFTDPRAARAAPNIPRTRAGEVWATSSECVEDHPNSRCPWLVAAESARLTNDAAADERAALDPNKCRYSALDLAPQLV